MTRIFHKQVHVLIWSTLNFYFYDPPYACFSMDFSVSAIGTSIDAVVQARSREPPLPPHLLPLITKSRCPALTIQLGDIHLLPC